MVTVLIKSVLTSKSQFPDPCPGQQVWGRDLKGAGEAQCLMSPLLELQSLEASVQLSPHSEHRACDQCPGNLWAEGEVSCLQPGPQGQIGRGRKQEQGLRRSHMLVVLPASGPSPEDLAGAAEDCGHRQVPFPLGASVPSSVKWVVRAFEGSISIRA